MILLAVLLGSLGVADLARARSGSRRRLWLAASVGIASFVLAATGSGQEWWWSLIAVVAVIGWLVSTGESDGSHRAGFWAVGVLAATAIVAFVWGPELSRPSGLLPGWYAALPYASLHAVSFTSFALVVGGALFLIETSNVIVRLALHGERSTSVAPAPSAASRPGTRGRSWRRPPSRSSAADAPTAVVVELKGGRFIGPLERVFLLALVLAGAFTAIAAIVAAKGIIRFPEISRDPGGSKAEYFLVGSFASWALVAFVVMLILLGPATT